jgi:hypothetical protein
MVQLQSPASASKKKYSKLGQKLSKNIFEFGHFLSEAVLGQNRFKWLIRHKFPLLRTTPASLIKRPITQNQSHTSSSKHQVLQ